MPRSTPHLLARLSPPVRVAHVRCRLHLRQEMCASGGRGAAPNPGTASKISGESTPSQEGVVISSWCGQALPDAEPLRARETPPLHSGPTAWQPPGARREKMTTPKLGEEAYTQPTRSDARILDDPTVILAAANDPRA
jgi:hypothetical protein